MGHQRRFGDVSVTSAFAPIATELVWRSTWRTAISASKAELTWGWYFDFTIARCLGVAGANMGERRINRRQRSFLRGFIYFDKRRGVMSCLVRDFSDEGARILFSETVTIPDVVNLHIPQRERTLRARVQWRRRRSNSPSGSLSLRVKSSPCSGSSSSSSARKRTRARSRRLKQPYCQIAVHPLPSETERTEP
jgi:hypothetical protein